MDYTKGLVNRIRAFELLLSSHPEYVERVVLLQVAVPSRTDVAQYQVLKNEIDQLIGRINGRFSTATWSPIRYIYGCLSQTQLAGLYRDSDIALITPLRDGMNLVAKEFVACRTREPGVLILSPFAGAGEIMKEALLVNPYELQEVANVLHTALQMPRDEREIRMSCLRYRENLCDVDNWMSSFMTATMLMMQENGNACSSPNLEPVQIIDFKYLLENYIGKTAKLALLLDFDGTLSPIVPHPESANLPVETRQLLQRLSVNPDVFIAVISGRAVEDVKERVGIQVGVSPKSFF